MHDAPCDSGVKFVTDPSDFMQIACMGFAGNHEIQPHAHIDHVRKVVGTQEVLVVKRGQIELSIYTSQRELVQCIILSAGDIALLQRGGHGLRCLTPVEMVEIKQGPYMGVEDKVRWK